MLHFLRGKASERKLRLFAVACCRRISHLLPDAACRAAVEVAERFADEEVTKADLAAVHATVHPGLYRDWPAAQAAAAARHASADSLPLNVAYYAFGHTFEAEWKAASLPDQFKPILKALVKLLQDIIGNPFRPAAVDPGWLTPTVTGLAHTIYGGRLFDRLPILADALEEAGCDNEDILNHCRSKGEHTRGCWVVDLVLAKS
jgi:hypothetical protein